MASPFRVFRKNQKVMMVVLTVLAMFSFLFIGQWTRLGESSAKYTDPDVFTWKYGTVRESEIRDQIARRQIVRDFLFNAGVAAFGERMARPLDSFLVEILPTSRRAIVNYMLYQKKADQLGIVISDAMVNSYLRSWTEDKLSGAQMSAIVRGLASRSGRTISQAYLFDALRLELATQKVQEIFSPLMNRVVPISGTRFYVFRGETPADRWDYFCRLKREATAEMMAVKVEDFTAGIPNPSTEELRKFYDQWKNDYPYYNQFPWPDLATPGFKSPAKAQFQYVKADYEKLVADEMPKITDEEIKTYYDRFKDDFFKKTKLPETPEKSTDDAATKPEDQTTAPADSSKSDGKGAAAESDGKADTKSSTGKSDTKSSDAKDAKTSSKADSKAAPGKAAEDKSGGSKTDAKSDAQKTPPAKSDKKSSDAKKSSRAAPASLDGELLALADDAVLVAQKSPESSPKGTTKSAPKVEAKADPKAAKSEPKDAAKAKDTAKTDGKAAPDSAAKSTPSADAKAPDAKQPDIQTPGTQTPTEAPVEYEPLEKVTETIRKRLAGQNVEDRIKKAFDGIEQQVDKYRSNYDVYRAKSQNAKADKGAPVSPPPPPPNLETLAKSGGIELEPKQTEMVSDRQAYQDYDLGKSRRTLSADDFSGRPFFEAAFQPNVKPYRTGRNDDNERNQYLWWKIAEEPQRVPPLDEIQPEVLRAWKLIQARKPALAKAEEYSAQARKLKQTLKETFGSTAGLDVSTVGPFTWLTRPLGQFTALPRLTEVTGVQQGGEEFMKAVFALSTGETGVAPNRPQNVYYVVQIESEKPPLDELHNEFMSAMSNQMTSLPYAMVSANEHSSIMYGWQKELQTEFGFQMAPGQSLAEERSEE